MMNWAEGAWMGGWLMAFFWVFIIIASIAVIRWLVVGDRFSGQAQERSALSVLQERYARGEIERDEFEQKRRDLEG